MVSNEPGSSWIVGAGWDGGENSGWLYITATWDPPDLPIANLAEEDTARSRSGITTAS